MNLSLRIYAFICLLLTQLRIWAQDDEEFGPLRDRGELGDSDLDIMEGMTNYPSFHIRHLYGSGPIRFFSPPITAVALQPPPQRK